MNKPFRAASIVTVCLCGVVLAAFAAAQPNKSQAAPAPASIAIVDLAKLTLNLDEAKVLKDRLTAQGEDFKKELQKIKDDLAAVTKDLEQMGKDQKGTPPYLKQLAQKYVLESTLKARGEALQQLIDISEGDNMKIIFGHVVEAVGRLGKDRGFDIVLWDDRSISPPPNTPATGAQVWSLIRDRRIMYASDRLDITADVLAQMNNEYKAAKK